MIRINLLPQKKVARSEKGQQSIVGGMLFLAGWVALAAYALVRGR